MVNPVTKANFGGSIAAIPGTDIQVYIAVVAFAINLIVAAGLSLLFHAIELPDGKDITRSSDYGADENDPKVAQIQREYPLGEPGDVVH